MLRRFRPSASAGTVARVMGVDLHWVEAGEGPPVVLLHGIGDSHQTWSKVVPALARTRRVLVPDLCGHGLSARPDAAYTLDWHARILGAWLDTLGLDEVDLVGHSYGGGIAQWMLLDHGHRVRKLGLVATGGLGREVALPLRLAAVPYVFELLGQPFMGPGTFIALQAAIRGIYSGSELVRLAVMNGKRGTARAFARSVRGVIDLGGQSTGFFDHAHAITRLPHIGLFWGERDPIIPVSHALRAADRIEGISVTRFEECAHYPHRERPEAFVEALEAFLAAEPAPASVRPVA